MDKPVMHPWPGERQVRFVGDHMVFSLRGAGGAPLPAGWKGFLRTNLGRAAITRKEIIETRSGMLPFAGASWRDIPLTETAGTWQADLCLTEPGYFRAKAYAMDPQGRQYWPEGPDVGVSIHPDCYRTANTIYCAFVRLFGQSKSARTLRDSPIERQLAALEKQGFTILPESGKLRDVIRELPHIIDTLGCRILHLLPVNPTPTTYARFGRLGSPYAIQDLTAIDPALVEFDRRTTGIDQFRELTFAVHARGARVFLDVVTNHTGWGSTLQENHPEWFLRDPQGSFVSPGAWGVTWEDLVEMDHRSPAPWDHLADAFLTWCRRGVDGFRCDAGYKVPMAAWRYIIARVRCEFPETLFLLEGLGGSWEATEILLTEGGMQWAYSELFQNYSGPQVAQYLDYSHNQSRRVGLYVHYSETHDNDRLAQRGPAWTLLRNQLCGLTSANGGFAFTCGVEWLATEKINVHQESGLSWNSSENIVPQLARLNHLLLNHPCFFDDASLRRLSNLDSLVYALLRTSSEGLDTILVLVNTDPDQSRSCVLDPGTSAILSVLKIDLLNTAPPPLQLTTGNQLEFRLNPGACHCLAAHPAPLGLAGDQYRLMRAAAAFGLLALSRILPGERLGTVPWRSLARRVAQDPASFLAKIAQKHSPDGPPDIMDWLEDPEPNLFPRVVEWNWWPDQRRITLVPPGHWLLIHDDVPFRATLSAGGETGPQFRESIALNNAHYAFFFPSPEPGDALLQVERYASTDRHVSGQFRYLSADPLPQPAFRNPDSDLVLLTNGIGGMARLCVHLGHVRSKYDCLLAANLHPSVPVDRHVLAKRVRVWVNADGFITALDRYNLQHFQPGPPALWRFLANAGDNRTVEIHLEADMLDQRNCTILRFHRPALPANPRSDSASINVRLIARVDIEDRNFHAETKRNSGADYHFSTHCRPLSEAPGFEFAPASDRFLRVYANSGHYHHEAEWCENIPHPIEQSRGQTSQGDAYSPGWFELPLDPGQATSLVASAESALLSASEINAFASERHAAHESHLRAAQISHNDCFGQQLTSALRAFVVRRGSGKSIIAGYPWFLDWGRDSLICARGLLAAGMITETQQLLVTFGRFEDHGTLPNSIHGDDASNRDTSDAPLWYGLVAQELSQRIGRKIYRTPVNPEGRTLADVLASIAEGYLRGTSNGIHVDPSSALVWSPPHFTWMDTNFPAGTPRAGYPVEIQALWIHLLQQLADITSGSGKTRWSQLASQAHASFHQYFWLEEQGYLSDLLIASSSQTAAQATPDSALRSNGLIAVSLNVVSGERARQTVAAASRYLVVPGALRSLAPLPVHPPLLIRGNDGRQLNDPVHPYWGRYEGDEDTRRKPAYHNGTAWTWTFPSFCEALAAAWDFQPPVVAAAKACLSSMDRFLSEGCLGHIPEILDGDSPHLPRGCDAQAWGATETLRVWKLLGKHSS